MSDDDRLKDYEMFEGKPVLDATVTPKGNQLTFFCPHCKKKHFHGYYPRAGSMNHHLAHCFKPNSPFKETGYLLRILNDPFPRE